ncbi:MAG: cyclase family protein [Paracoccus sp. (in: a-proteobacteria)]|uniref:cyclase family protein n=1 Tax=Paracoccus sp. TaxID=267 RepID=UPI0039E3C976
MTEDDVRAIFERIKNWGRWGESDSRGALNHITPDLRRRAAGLVHEGVSVSCAQELNTASSALNPCPVQHYMVKAADVAPERGYSAVTDFIGIAAHGPAHTHIDAFCHLVFDGYSYNGVPASAMRSTGCQGNDLTATEHGVVTRGVLLDIAASRGVDWLDIDQPIRTEDLLRAEDAAGLRVGQGDAVIIRTGRHERARALGETAERNEGKLHLAGMHPETLLWLHEREVSLLMSDGGHDVLPSPYPTRLPIHIGTLVFLGVHLIDNARLDDLVTACASRNRQEFLFTLAPLRLRGGTGCAVNPLATF